MMDDHDFERALAAAKAQFRLDIHGVHGLPHWERVLKHGTEIAKRDPRVDRKVVSLFAVLHDSQRLNDGDDPKHGLRAAIWTIDMDNTGLINLSREQGIELFLALRDHSVGGSTEAPTVQACWDADRLDLGRVGIKPEAKYLGSEYARRPDVIEAAWQESQNWLRAYMMK